MGPAVPLALTLLAGIAVLLPVRGRLSLFAFAFALERGTLYVHTPGVETWVKDAGGWCIRRRVELARGRRFLPGEP